MACFFPLEKQINLTKNLCTKARFPELLLLFPILDASLYMERTLNGRRDALDTGHVD